MMGLFSGRMASHFQRFNGRHIRYEVSMIKMMHRNLVFTVILVGSMVATFLLEFMVPTELLAHGLVPRTGQGLYGILTMPFLHANLSHLTGNLVSLIVLLLLLMVFHPEKMISIVVSVILMSGLLLWIFGRPASHVGASGLVYGLAGFMVVAGIAQQRFLEVVGSAVVVVLYGNSLFWGLMPFHPGVSWDGHLAGGIVGIMLGWASRPEQRIEQTSVVPHDP